MAKKRDEYVRPKEPAALEFEGESLHLTQRDIYAPDHELVRAHPDLFEPIEVKRARPKVEQMTATPGERRG